MDCYRYVLSNPNIDITMMAARNTKEMEENLKTLETDTMSDEEKQWMERVGAWIYHK